MLSSLSAAINSWWACAGNLIHAKAQDEGSGPPTQTTGPEGNVKVARLMGAVEYGRPLAQGWNGTLGINFQRANCLDDHNQPMTKVSDHNQPMTKVSDHNQPMTKVRILGSALQRVVAVQLQCECPCRLV